MVVDSLSLVHCNDSAYMPTTKKAAGSVYQYQELYIYAHVALARGTMKLSLLQAVFLVSVPW